MCQGTDRNVEYIYKQKWKLFVPANIHSSLFFIVIFTSFYNVKHLNPKQIRNLEMNTCTFALPHTSSSLYSAAVTAVL